MVKNVKYIFRSKNNNVSISSKLVENKIINTRSPSLVSGMSQNSQKSVTFSDKIKVAEIEPCKSSNSPYNQLDMIYYQNKYANEMNVENQNQNSIDSHSIVGISNLPICNSSFITNENDKALIQQQKSPLNLTIIEKAHKIGKELDQLIKEHKLINE